jgi:multiple sugar transport system permease protein
MRQPSAPPFAPPVALVAPPIWAFSLLLLCATGFAMLGLAAQLGFLGAASPLVLWLAGAITALASALVALGRSRWRRIWALGAVASIALALLATLIGLPPVLPGGVALLAVAALLLRPTELPRQAEASLMGGFFVLPALMLLVVWHFAPAFFALFLSLFDKFDFVREAKFSGLDNYLILLLRDPLFWKSLLNSFWYTVATVPVGIIIATFIAILLNERIRFQGLFRTLFFLPYITALTASAAVWKWIYNPEFGVLNALLGTPGQTWLENPNGILSLLAQPLGIQLPELLHGPSVALLCIAVMSVWHHLGYSVVILLAGLQSVPPEYYEAANLDGASWWDQVRYITWPLLSPTTFFLSLTGLIGAFQVFTQILILTPSGGVLGDTTTIVKYLYDKGFRDSNFSYASAMAMVLFFIIVIFSLLQNKVLSRRVTYDI